MVDWGLDVPVEALSPPDAAVIPTKRYTHDPKSTVVFQFEKNFMESDIVPPFT